MTYNEPTRTRPTGLYKDPKNGKLMGVCAGIADYLDINVCAIRTLYIIGSLFTGVWPGLFLYILLGCVLKPRPENRYQSRYESRHQRGYQSWHQPGYQSRSEAGPEENVRRDQKPDYSAADLRRRFKDLERRTAAMEERLTSKRFKLERELNNLDK